MPQICPKCSYIRKTTDSAPEWQCPSCEVAYSKAGGEADASYGKYGKPAISTGTAGTSGGKLKLAVLLGILAVTVVVARPLIKARSLRHASEISEMTAANTVQPEVILYGASWCGYCAATRRYLEQNGIRYTELDVEKTTEGYNGYKKLGAGGVPIIVVGDQVLHGYSEEALGQTLGPWLKKG
ncbi:glutaredoxin family protein [Undibacterium sp. TJN25]|uniref:glutaredoxin family protein n=1 Tax=Undibacterium sp. TJN25 TaxID=3413056 RepID=UPI003BF1F731